MQGIKRNNDGSPKIYEKKIGTFVDDKEQGIFDSSEIINTFSIGFDEPSFDETKYAKEVANFLGTKHHSIFLSFPFGITRSKAGNCASIILEINSRPSTLKKR